MDDPSTDLIDRWRDGDQEAATELWNRYAQRLVQLAERHISGKFKKSVDAEDVMVSVIETLMNRVKLGKFSFEHDEDLWKLLVSITLNKVRNKIRREEAREFRPGEFDKYYAAIMSRSPGTYDTAEFSDLLIALFRRLGPYDSEILKLRMEGLTQEEIAEKGQVDVRTVRRRLGRIREHLHALYSDS